MKYCLITYLKQLDRHIIVLHYPLLCFLKSKYNIPYHTYKSVLFQIELFEQNNI